MSVIKSKIRKNYFQDALRLMRISKSLQVLEGVRKAVVVMATEKAKFALSDAGLLTPEIKDAQGSDLVMVVEADSEEAAGTALKKMEEMVLAGAQESPREAPNILSEEIQAINLGLESFREALELQGVKVVHVNWRVPAKGDNKLINILKKMY